MALVTEILKKCGVKISAKIKGVPSYGSGVIYETPNYCDYNYVLTAKHTLQEYRDTPFRTNIINHIEIQYDNEGVLDRLAYISSKKIEDCIIEFEEDLVIIIISKKEGVNFPLIFVSDALNDADIDFFCWSIFSANLEELNRFKFERDDPINKRLKFITPPSYTTLKGMSGAGIFLNERNVLYGIVSRYPTDKFENATIDCASTTFAKVNRKLASINRVELDTTSSKHKREIGKSVVGIHQAIINDVCLDLELAKERL